MPIFEHHLSVGQKIAGDIMLVPTRVWRLKINKIKPMLLIALVFSLMISTFISSSTFAKTKTKLKSRVRTQLVDKSIYPYVTVLDSSSQGMHLVFEPPSPRFTSRAAGEVPCQQVQIEGLSQSSDLAVPPLPIQGVMLGIPVDAQPTVEILNVETVLLPESYHLCPQEEPILVSMPEMPGWQEIPLPTQAVATTQDVFLPAQMVETIETGLIRSQRYLQLRLNPVQYNSLTGEMRYYSKIEFEIRFASAIVLEGRRVNEGVFEAELQDQLLNYEQAADWRIEPAHSVLQSVYEGNFYKITVEANGIYQLTYEKLLEAGLPVSTIDPATFQLFDQGAQVALRELGNGNIIFEGGESLLFYGKALDSKYGRSNVYWLTWGGSVGLRMQSQAGTPVQGYPVPPSFLTTLHFEKNVLYMTAKPSGGDQDHWYWANVTHIETTPAAFKVNVGTLPQAGGHTITVSGLLRGNVSTPFHRAKIYLNGTYIGAVDMPMDTEKLFSFSGIPQSLLIAGENILGVLTPLESAVTFNTVLVNWFEITYFNGYKAEVDQVYFDGDLAGSWQFQVDGFSTSDLEVYDLTDETNPAYVTGFTVEASSSGQKLAFEAVTAGERNYLAQSIAKRMQPASIVTNASSNWKSAQNAADYLIISHANFMAQAQSLADYRSTNGYQTVVIDVQDIYDEFNDGELNPQAIQNFLTYAYANWATPTPVYVVLMGDGHFDFLDNYGFAETNFIPPYLADVDPWRGETAADNRYACVSGWDILPDLRIGRLPVRTPEEAIAAVQNIIAYETTPPQEGWNANLTFLADDTDSAGDYATDTDAIISGHLPDNYNAEKIYYKRTHSTTAAVKTALVSAINAGRLIVHYAGHSSTQAWGSEGFLLAADISSLANGDKLPFVLPMTCMEGSFVYPSPASNINKNVSIGESIVRKANAGAIASWSPTGFGLHGGHMVLGANLFDNLFKSSQTELGYLTNSAKLHLYATTSGYQDLIDTYVLFGDPALRLQAISLPLDAATLLTATAVSPDQIDLTWQDNSDSEDFFHIERWLDEWNGWEQIADVTSDVINYSDNGLVAGLNYFYRVRAFRTADLLYSEYSNTASVYPTSASGVSFTDIVAHIGGMRVSWTTENETDIIGFNLYRSDNLAEGDWILLNQVPSTSYGLSFGNTYEFTDACCVSGVYYTYQLEVITVGPNNPAFMSESTLCPWWVLVPSILRDQPAYD